MKNKWLIVIVFVSLFIKPGFVAGQEESISRLHILEKFANSLFLNHVGADTIISQYMNVNKDPKSIEMTKWMIKVMRDSLSRDYRALYTSKQIKFVPYSKIKTIKEHAFFYESAEKDIYGLVSNGRILMYALYSGDRIKSFFLISKGRNDYSYFID